MTPLQLGTKEDTRLHRGVFSTLQKSQKSSIIHVRRVLTTPLVTSGHSFQLQLLILYDYL